MNMNLFIQLVAKKTRVYVRCFGLLMTFAAFHANQSMIVSQIFPLLNSQNLTSNQVLLFASLIGPMQVTARLIFFLIEFITKKDIPISPKDALSAP